MKMRNVSLIAPLVISLLAAGCSSMQSMQKVVTGSDAPAASTTPEPPPAPKMVRRKQASGMDAAQVNQLLATKNAKRIRTGLVGKTVTLELAKPATPSADGKTFQASGADDASFVCKTSEPGFEGGEVTAKIRTYKAAGKDANASFELDNCTSNFVTVAEPATKATAASAAPAVPAAAAPKAGSTAASGPKPGMDAQGNVIDSSKVESGSGRTVKGINDYEGEITGNPARNSKFTSLQIGMSMKQVTDITGAPTDSGAYVTGKAWIPFYFGGDRTRMELTYKGQGRLIFAGGSLGNMSGGNPIWIIHNPSESGYR